MKDTNVIIRINPELKKNFVKVIKEYDASISGVLEAYIKHVIELNKIPQEELKYLNNEVFPNPTIGEIRRVLLEEITTQSFLHVLEICLIGDYAIGKEKVNSPIEFRFTTEKGFTFTDLEAITETLKESLHRNVKITTTGQLSEKYLNYLSKEELFLYCR